MPASPDRPARKSGPGGPQFQDVFTEGPHAASGCCQGLRLRAVIPWKAFSWPRFHDPAASAGPGGLLAQAGCSLRRAAGSGGLGGGGHVVLARPPTGTEPLVPLTPWSFTALGGEEGVAALVQRDSPSEGPLWPEGPGASVARQSLSFSARSHWGSRLAGPEGRRAAGVQGARPGRCSEFTGRPVFPR